MIRAVILFCIACHISQIGTASRIKHSLSTKESKATGRSERPIVEREAIIANVYHVSKSWGMKVLNTVLFAGGAYHVAIEAFGVEVGYGGSGDCTTSYQRSRSGLYKVEPRNDPGHTYYQSVPLGNVNMTYEQFKQQVQKLSVEWRGCDYDLLSQNCVSFAQALAYELLGPDGHLPGWMSRLMTIGEKAFPVISTVGVASSQSSQAVGFGVGKAVEGSKIVVESSKAGSVASGQAIQDFQASREAARREAMMREAYARQPHWRGHYA